MADTALEISEYPVVELEYSDFKAFYQCVKVSLFLHFVYMVMNDENDSSG